MNRLKETGKAYEDLLAVRRIAPENKEANGIMKVSHENIVKCFHTLQIQNGFFGALIDSK